MFPISNEAEVLSMTRHNFVLIQAAACVIMDNWLMFRRVDGNDKFEYWYAENELYVVRNLHDGSCKFVQATSPSMAIKKAMEHE